MAESKFTFDDFLQAAYKLALTHGKAVGMEVDITDDTGQNNNVLIINIEIKPRGNSDE
jgi:hypothetical protein